jgi:hypothetical protein
MKGVLLDIDKAGKGLDIYYTLLFILSLVLCWLGIILAKQIKRRETNVEREVYIYEI